MATQVISAGGVLATTSVLLTTILGVSRLAYAMAERKELPTVLARLHRKFDTPYIAIVVSSLLMIVLVFVSNLSQIVAVATLASLAYYGIGNLSAVRLGGASRQYPKVIPWLGLISCVGFSLFILFKTPEIWLIGVIILAAGGTYYMFNEKKVRFPKR